MTVNRELIRITAVGFFAGTLYSLLTDDITLIAPLLNGILIGTVGGFLTGIMELYVFRQRKIRTAFLLIVFTKALTYFIMLVGLIVAIKGVIDSLFLKVNFMEYLGSKNFSEFILHGEFKKILIFSLFVIFIIIFMKQLSRYLGRGIMYYLVTGRYYRPRKELRIFLLLDICSSTSIAEKMDQIAYFKLLDQFFYDVFTGVRNYNGYIYRYVGDQVTITWPVTSSRRVNANALRTFFHIKHKLHLNRKAYLDEFGFVPEFRGTAHLGDVITGEIGDVKTQLVYQGVTLYEVGRMEKFHGRRYSGLCISDVLLQELDLPEIYECRTLGELTSTKKSSFSIYEVEET